MPCLIGVALAVVVCLAAPAPAFAAPGDADATFSDDGFAFADQTGSGYDGVFVVAMAAQPDGKLLAVVRAVTSQHYYVVGFTEYVVRFNADGSIDRGFGDKGSALLPTDWDWQYGEEGIAVQSTGRILVADTKSGVQGSGLSVLALTPQGNLDTAFGGGDGIALQQLSSDLWANTYRLAVGPDDKIVLAGVQASSVSAATPSALVIERLLPDGETDSSFSDDGAITLPSLDDTSNTPSSLDVDSAGRTVVTTSFDDRDAARQFPIVAVRLTDAGDLDPDFSGDGIASADTPDIPDVGDGVVDSQGRVLALAQPLVNLVPSTVTRFTTQGQTDATFGDNGTAGLVPLGIPAANFGPAELAVDSSDRPIVLAAAGTPSGPAIGRLTQSGSPDPDLPLEPNYPPGASSALGFSMLRVGERAYVGGTATMRGTDQLRAFVFRAKLDDSGPSDRDGDGIANTNDSCRYVYGPCPTIPRKLKLLFVRKFRELDVGSTPVSECQTATAIDIYKRRPGKDRIVQTMPPGTLETHLKQYRGGTFYAKVPAITLNTGKCPRSQSSAVHIPGH
jgi:uncharacterized delta-60 repeat protein